MGDVHLIRWSLFVQRLFNARKHEAETEEHMRMLDEREVGRLRQEIGKVDNELTNVNDRKSGLAVREEPVLVLAIRGKCLSGM